MDCSGSPGSQSKKLIIRAKTAAGQARTDTDRHRHTDRHTHTTVFSVKLNIKQVFLSVSRDICTFKHRHAHACTHTHTSTHTHRDTHGHRHGETLDVTTEKGEEEAREEAKRAWRGRGEGVKRGLLFMTSKHTHTPHTPWTRHTTHRHQQHTVRETQTDRHRLNARMSGWCQDESQCKEGNSCLSSPR